MNTMSCASCGADTEEHGDGSVWRTSTSRIPTFTDCPICGAEPSAGYEATESVMVEPPTNEAGHP